MKKARSLLVLDGVLLTILAVGAVLLATVAAIHSLDSGFAIPAITVVTHWNYFGTFVLVLILVAVPLYCGLTFWSATKPQIVTPTDKKPEVYHVTSKDDQPRVNIHAPDNQGTVIGVNEGTVNIGREPRYLIPPWSLVKRSDGMYQLETTITTDISTVVPRITIIVRSPSLTELNVRPSGGVGYSRVSGSLDGGQFVSMGNVKSPFLVTAVTKNEEKVNVELTTWNPLEGP